MSKTLPQKLLDIQKKMGAVSKTSVNPHFKSTFADLNSCLEVAKEALHSEGVSLVQPCGADQFGQYVETCLIDGDSGQQLSGKVYLVGTPDMQKTGAAITYARRFGIKSLLGMEDTDDDGETAVGRGPQPKAATPAAKPVTPTQAPVAGPVTRKTINDKIALTGKVLIDSKRMTTDEAKAMLDMYKVANKEEMSDDQAKKFLAQLEEKLK